MSEKANTYQTLRSVNVADGVEERDGLSYLSWAYVWDKVMGIYPDATYEVKSFDGKPYLYDEDLGFMVWTSVTINGVCRDMWLPVMDGKNKSMKREAYEYQTRNGKRKVESATMFDINKSIMRCLVKNLAVFGLGLSLWLGDDLETKENICEPKENIGDRKDTGEIITDRQLEWLKKNTDLVTQAKILRYYRVERLEAMSKEQALDAIKKLRANEG